ncbi:MAG: hypothetical protein QXG34_03445, partial [Candidatus Bathyarchaeia archaeon]
TPAHSKIFLLSPKKVYLKRFIFEFWMDNVAGWIDAVSEGILLYGVMAEAKYQILGGKLWWLERRCRH